jgi:DNA-binding FadR family transcriptional regulator
MYPIPHDRQIRVPKTAEIVAGRIRNAIIRGELKDGDSLPAEAKLMADFEVSRPTLREAIRVLESESLITVARGARGGARISAPTSDTVARAAGTLLQAKGATVGDLYEMRTIIEPPAARLVAERNAMDGSKVLRAHVAHEYTLVEDIPKVTLAIAQFHRLLMEQCGNITLTVVAHALQGLVERHLALVQRKIVDIDTDMHHKRIRFGLRSHVKLVDLIEQGHGAEAERHWLNHMNAAGSYWVKDIPPTSVVELLDEPSGPENGHWSVP